MFHSVAETDYDGSILTLGYEGNQSMAVFDGPGGLETVTRFDRAVITRNRVDFYVEPRSRNERKRKTGSMEAAEQIVSFIREAPNESELEYTVEEQ